MFASAHGQNNLRKKNLQVDRDTIQLDSLLILPSTVKVYQNNIELDSSYFQIVESKGLFIPSEKLIRLTDSIHISYRVFHYDITKPVFQRHSSQINRVGNISPKRYSIYNSGNIGILGNSQLQKQGNYSRSISYGNNQDVVMNSNLNLQLSGKLTNDVNIIAAISDNNVPIQPDGNTQKINDFDRIYIKLFDETKELTLGDYEIESPQGHYMRFYKKVQGGRFSGILTKDEKSGNELKSTLSASIAKGKFNRMEISGQEGVQGPYRLIGANNETYIVVLAGSEKVYIDGQLLKRGEQNDYVIDYNLAELSFTTNKPITGQSRIIIEFEYSEENYSRYLVFNSNELKTKKGKFWLNFYHEADSKNRPIDQNLSNENKQLLSEIGDNLSLAKVPNIEVVEYSNDFILYKKISKSIGSETFDVYEYSTEPELAIYKVNFAFVGPNNGNYKQMQSSANGKVYEWIDPLNGTPQGDFDPVIQLISPQKQEMMSLGGDFKIGKKTNTKFEFALSNKDLNTYSSIDDGDNKGLAVKFQLNRLNTFRDTSKHLRSSLSFNHINKNFEQIENFRSVEFERDWNIDPDTENTSENFVAMENSYSNSNWGMANYKFSILKKSSDYTGIRNSVGWNYHKKGLEIKLNADALKTDQKLAESKFWKHKLNSSYSLRFMKIGIDTESEHNKWENKKENNLLSNSFAFHSYKVFIANRDSAINHFELYYQKRKNYSPIADDLEAQSESQDMGAMLWLKKNNNNKLKIQTVYRKLSILEDLNTDEKPENTFLGKLEHQARIKKGLITSSTHYELGAGLESEKEYSYVEVNQGQGVYKWTDYNNNNIKELNEFEIAAFKDEANYIRISTNTANYQKVYTSEFRQSILLNFRRLKGKGKASNLLKRFRNRFAYRIAKKSLSNDFSLYGNPFQSNDSSSDIITMNTSFQNTLSYKKVKSRTSWDIIHQSSKGKQLLTQGIESRKFSQNGLRFNWRINSYSKLTNRIDLGKKSLEHESFADKNYKLNEFKNGLKLKFQPTLALQLGLNYTFKQKENRIGEEESSSHDIGCDFQYAVAKSGKLMGTFNFLNLDYNANQNTSIAYEMLEGFLPGNNSTWSLLYNQKLSKVFQLNITYNGRQSQGSNTVHVGSVELRAYF